MPAIDQFAFKRDILSLPHYSYVSFQQVWHDRIGGPGDVRLASNTPHLEVSSTLADDYFDKTPGWVCGALRLCASVVLGT